MIELPTFYQDFEGRRRNGNDYTSATRDVARLLAEFHTKGVDGVVLDLRNNGGGSLDEAVQLTGLFIDQARWSSSANPAVACRSTTTAPQAWPGMARWPS